MDAVEYDEGTLQLEPGDRVCLFSDGILEQTDASGDVQYGTNRLREFLTSRSDVPAEDLVAEVANELATWAGATSFADDVSLVVVEWLGRGE